MKTFRFVSIVVIVVMLAGMAGYGGGKAVLSQEAAARPAPVAIGAMPMAGTHLVPPSRNALDAILAREGLSQNATNEQRMAAEKEWFSSFEKQSDTWVNPKFQEYVNEREKQLGGLPSSINKLNGFELNSAVPVTATIFAMAVDFGAVNETIEYEKLVGDTCTTATTVASGPRVGQVPAPEADDNFTLWYSPAQVGDANFYKKIIFGHEGVGRVRMDLKDPDDGLDGINLAGYTVQDYYDNVAGEGNVTINGTVEGWVTVDHSEAYYGADNCGGSHGGGTIGPDGKNVPVTQLVIDAVDKFNAANPNYDWRPYDANHDGILDTFWIIHAGMGQESGGGAEGDFSIWAHSSDLRYSLPEGYKVYEGDTNTTADDIYVGPYTMQPEMSETGVFAEEFGHNFFGLPDLYTTDSNNSIGDWAIMSGGAWTGWLGGTVPASMPLWFKMIAAAEVNGEYVPLNWHLPMVYRDYNAPAADIQIGQLEKTPASVNRGVRVNLPKFVENIPNNAGTGAGAYSGTGRDETDITMTRKVSVPASGSAVLSMKAYWSIEKDWDYGYVMVGSTLLDDMGSYFTTTNRNGNNLGVGLTGVGNATLSFDLSAYKGTTVDLTLRYKTDAAATEAGWWVDDLKLDGVLLDDFSGASGTGTFPGWTNSDPGWYTVPTEVTYTNYYLVEWRSNTKYDRMVKSAYVFIDDDTVERVPYNVPAALIYYRNTKYASTYAQRGNYKSNPSFGPKYQLLIVDQNWQGLRLVDENNLLIATLSGRASAYDAGLTLQPTEPFSLTSVNFSDGVAVGPFDFPGKSPVTHFNDALGYYGGYYIGAPCDPGYLCYNERDGSAVIPARGPYSTRITDGDYNPLYDYFGWKHSNWAPSWLGTGNPAEDNVQHGVNIKLLSKSGDDAYNSVATLRFYNYSVDFLSSVASLRSAPDGVHVTYQVNVQNVGAEDATNLSMNWISHPGQQIVGFKTSGPEDLVVNQEAPNAAARPQDQIALSFPKLPAGQEIVVTIDTFTPMAMVSGTEFAFETTMVSEDGQIFRGPYWYDLEGSANFIYLPNIIIQP